MKFATLILASLFATLLVGCPPAKPIGNMPPLLRTVKHEEHYYIISGEGHSRTVIHHPDCPCHFKDKIETNASLRNRRINSAIRCGVAGSPFRR